MNAATDTRTNHLETQGKQATLLAFSSTEANRLATWLGKNSGWLAIWIIVVGFAVRVRYAVSAYLNCDEAQHFNVARPNSWLEAYQANHMLSHPPLLTLVLHGTLFLGRSEVILRIPSLIGGTLALWLTFAWIRRSLGEIPALAGLVFLALSPAAVSASTEVRQYGLLLAFVCGALYATERAFTERSMTWAIVQGFCLLGAMLTHFTAPVVIASLDLYVLLRYLSGGIPVRILWAFGLCQLVLAGVLVWLYFSDVRGNPVFGPATLSYLDPGFMPAHETLPRFVLRALNRTFTYLVSDRLAPLSLMVFLAGLATLVSIRSRARLLLFLMLISPFILGLVAAICHVLPFAGSRHQTYLLPFVAAGFAAVLTGIHKNLAATFVLLGLLLASVGAVRTTLEYKSRIVPIGDMTAAIAYMEGNVPRDAWLFVDDQTRYILGYYLARNDSRLPAPWQVECVKHLRSAPMVEVLGGYRVLTPKKFVFSLRADEAISQMREAARALNVPPGKPVWIVSAGWRDAALASQLPAGSYQYAKEFGNISVVKTTWPIQANWPVPGSKARSANPRSRAFLASAFSGDSRH